MLDDPDEELDAANDGIILVPLWKRPDGTFTTRAGTQVDLNADELPNATTRELACSAMHLTVGEDLSAEALAALSELPVPDCFTRSGWLADHHPLPLHNGHCTVGPLVFNTDSDNGIALTESEGDVESEDRGERQHDPRC